MPPPSLPGNLRSVEVGTTSIELLWIQDEVVTGYILDITYNRPCTLNGQTMFLDGSLSSYTITGLEEGSSYTIELSALNGAGRSEGSQLQILTVGTGEQNQLASCVIFILLGDLISIKIYQCVN